MLGDVLGTDVDVAQLVRALRRALRLTQEQFARRLDVTFGTVNGWENGKHVPIPALRSRLLEIAREAGVTVPPPASSSRRNKKARSS
jgi:putative transcriptional regulator